MWETSVYLRIANRNTLRDRVVKYCAITLSRVNYTGYIIIIIINIFNVA